MLQTFPYARDFPIAWTLAAAVLSAGASCAPRFDPANARAQFSSKAQSMEGSEPTTADPHPSTNSPAPIAVATTGATNVAVPQIAAPAQSEVLVVDSVIIPVPPSLPVESLLHEPTDAQTTHEASRVLREASVSKWAAVRAHAIEASIRSPKLLAELVPAALDDENRGVRFVACMAIAEARMPTLAKAVAAAVGGRFARVQCTPDLLPGDITGNPVLEEVDGRRSFTFQPGPVFANILLADEINRASPKTQSALLEAMQERCVTVMGQTHALPNPFLVLATQNPIELEGTYPLPEAQLDRFLFKVDVPAASVETLERIVLEREIGVPPEVPCVIDAHALTALQDAVRRVYMPPPVAIMVAMILGGISGSGPANAAGVRYGASPRAALALSAAARARGLCQGRINASYEDVRDVALPVLRHRLVLDYGARLEGLTPAGIIARLLDAVPAHDKPLPTSLKAAKV